MRMCEVEGFKDIVSFFFIKFSDNKDHLQSLSDGNLYMNNFKYFVDLEKQTGIAGMGDQYEVSNVMNDIKLSFYHSETNELIAEATSKKSVFRYNDLLNKPVFCLFSVGPEMVEVIDDDGETINARIIFTEEQKDKIVNHFGKNALVIEPVQFLENCNKKFKEDEIHFVSGLVDYSDFNINISKRIDSYINQDLSMFFSKDNSFKHQNEFRLVILNKDVDKNFEVNIGSLSNGSLIDTDRLINDQFSLQIRRRK